MARDEDSALFLSKPFPSPSILGIKGKYVKIATRFAGSAIVEGKHHLNGGVLLQGRSKRSRRSER